MSGMKGIRSTSEGNHLICLRNKNSKIKLYVNYEVEIDGEVESSTCCNYLFSFIYLHSPSCILLYRH